MKFIRFTKSGIYCPQADIYIDPWRRVKKAIITHAHADHARPGMGHYLAHHHSLPLLKSRLGENIVTQGLNYNEELYINGVRISLHPAGHIPGSSQVRLEYKGEVWVISGDYKTEFDGLSEAFESVKCHSFLTESTFGLPVYRWKDQDLVFEDINRWWSSNREMNKHSIIYAYSLGKAQRILSGLNFDIGPVLVHPAIKEMNDCLISSGYSIPKTIELAGSKGQSAKSSIIISPPGAAEGKLLNPFKDRSTAFVSGWMAVRGQRRRMNLDRGFVMSDHADWPGLNKAVRESGAEKVYVTHGYSDSFSRWLNEEGTAAEVVKTEFESEGQ